MDKELSKGLTDSYKKLSISYLPSNITGRETETLEIEAYIKKFLNSKPIESNFMYICGLPGNGKTIILRKILTGIKNSIEINAASLFSPKQLYSELLLFFKKIKRRPKIALEFLESFFCTKSSFEKKYIIFIDEIDFISAKSPRVLYNLIDWISISPKFFLLIGISNSMTLLETFDKKVRSRIGLVKKIPFFPYSYEQIQNIIETRLLEISLFSDAAIEMVARKVASVSGDVRKALLMARTALEIYEEEFLSSGKFSSCNVSRVKRRKKFEVNLDSVLKAANELQSSPQIVYLKCLSVSFQFIILQFALKMKAMGAEFLDWEIVYNSYKNYHFDFNFKSDVKNRNKNINSSKTFSLENYSKIEFLNVLYKLENIGLLKRLKNKYNIGLKFGLCLFISDIKFGLKEGFFFQDLIEKL